MEIKKVGQFENVNQEKMQKPGISSDIAKGPSFAETFQSLQTPTTQPNKVATALQNTDPVKFSNHALERMMSRGINFSKADVNKLSEAVQRAADKGSKDSLILMNDTALIVSVKNKTVVTVMDKNALKDNVFTNIDSTIVM